MHIIIWYWSYNILITVKSLQYLNYISLFDIEFSKNIQISFCYLILDLLSTILKNI